MNPDTELENLLREKGMLRAPASLLAGIQSVAARRARLRTRAWPAFAAAAAACLVFGVLLFSHGKGVKAESAARNAAFLNGIFGTFSSADAQADSAYSWLAVDDGDLPAILSSDKDTMEVTLVDF